PASAEHSRPLALGAASRRSWPRDTTDEAPFASAVSLPTWVQVLPPSWVTYTPPVEPVLGSTLSSETYTAPSGSSATVCTAALAGNVTALNESPPSVDRYKR